MGLGRSRGGCGQYLRLEDLDKFVGRWVAVKDGRVIADANSSQGLVIELRKLDEPLRKGAVAQFVPKPSKSFMVGVG